MTHQNQVETAVGKMVLDGLTPMRVLGSHSQHFRLNHDHQFVLLSARDANGLWEAALHKDVITLLRSLIEGQGELYKHHSLVLQCGEDRCWLYEVEWRQLVDLDQAVGQKIFARRPQNCSFRVWSESGQLKRTVPLNRFLDFATAA